ncbi:hypothetical protein JD844_020799 [Phrynosoma platyrhinos]|uniref:Serpin domain-containing protein n=1 Tax=Phrynosoma platyrhinos TaxID=52577 RepID=A0ABQ7SSV2_PHRPL|nr:hypothetical protein JD844_020799 [Phrynosoma platyrhinos]
MSNFNLWLLLAGLITVFSCIVTGYKPYKNSSLLKIAPGNADFAFRFYHQLAVEATNKNIIFSPLSISTAFALLSLGAKNTTLSQLLSGLGFNQTEISEQEIHAGFRHLLHMLNHLGADIELSIGNALFTHEQFKLLKKFLADAKHFYQSDVFPTNFKNLVEAKKKINSYIEEKTHGKLVDVVKGLDPDVIMVLVNYIFLKAYWENPFNSENTQEDDFFVDEETKVTVSMMNKDSNFKSYYDKDLSCEVVQLPYKGNLSALFILPEQGKLKLVEDALRADVVSKWLHSLEIRRLAFYLPRFSLTGSYDIGEIFKKLGVTQLFTDHADLSGISQKPNLKVSKFVISVENPFNSENTQEDDFFVDEETKVTISMMNKDSNFKSYYDKDLSCEVVQLPYKGNLLALFILPEH